MIPTNASYRQASPRRGIVQPTQKVIGVASKGAHNRLKYQQQRHQAGAASSHSPAGTHSTNDETPPSTSEREYPSSRPASSDQAKIRPSSSPPKSRSKSRSGSRTRSHQLHGDEAPGDPPMSSWSTPTRSHEKGPSNDSQIIDRIRARNAKQNYGYGTV